MNKDVERLGMSFNLLTARALVVESALQALIQSLPPDSKTAFATDFRSRVAKAMQEIEPNLNPATDRHMTASVNALLQAAGAMPP